MPAGSASTMMRAIFPPLPVSWSLGKDTKERTDRTNFNQFAPPSWRKVIQTKSRQNLVFDPSGCSGGLRGCPFLEVRRALLREGLGRCDGIRGWSVFVELRTPTLFSRERQEI